MKRKFYHFLLGFAVLTGAGNSYAQTPQTRNCSTMEVYERQVQADPGFLVRRNEIEAYTQKKISSSSRNHRTGVITIPVVVHVVYNTTAQNISDAQIQSQINILNQDFRKLNADASKTPAAFAGLAADAQVEFCLAKRDPNGNPTTGITRTQTTKTSFSDYGDPIKYTSQGGKDAWDRNQYLNLWVGNLSGGLLGYAQFPGGPAATDGVVCTYSGFGNTGTAAAPFNLGRTATHEVGHWLNLYHIWGDDNGACTGSDQVSDTPNQADSNGGCPTFPKVTCSNTPNGDMFMNYMDYTDDRCMYMFTTGQKARMDAVLDAGGFRASLATSQGCVEPGGTTTCNVPTGLSTSALTSTSVTLNWAASGATSYNVRIKATSSATWTNFTATTNSLSLTGLTASTTYEYQVAGVCSGTPSAFSPSYTFTAPASGTSPGTTLTIGTGSTVITQAPYGTYYMDQRVQYIITKAELTAAGYNSGSSLSSLAFYVSTAQSLVMNGYTIKLAHTTSSAFGSSSYLAGTNTATVYNAAYTTTANSWNTHTFSTPFVYNGTDNILIDICFNNSTYTQNSTVLGTALSSYRALYKQQDVSSGGICTTTTGTLSYNRPNMKLTFGSGGRAREITLGETSPASLAVFPNPVNAEMSLNYTLTEEKQHVQLEIYNLVGKLVYTQEIGSQPKGAHTFAVPMQKGKMANLPNGMYICRLRNAGEMPQIRFVIAR
ncbi:M43 family zinc metalloprotease [Adhaeribacter soli]|uniref:T9SS type A sorting domain-containing protein n=1 Tax=Adhaeribacter soli TaxID=2607655 RepID=A0A5N1IT10_9BACT|nr:M43 family zinc metalloprotease [Adhaeribacter soli]KAA9332798.1 T9SS type A sorting domain-containing protein [Adhaeribacter soli]